MHYRRVNCQTPEATIRFVTKAIGNKVNLSKARAEDDPSFKATGNAGKRTVVMMNKCAILPELARLLQ